MYFPNVEIIFPWKKSVALHLNKLYSPLPKDALCQAWLKLVSGSGEEDFFFLISSTHFRYLPSENGVVLNLMFIPCSQGCFVPSLVEIDPVVLEKMKIWKVYWRTDDGQHAIRKVHLSFQLWGADKFRKRNISVSLVLESIGSRMVLSKKKIFYLAASS